MAAAPRCRSLSDSSRRPELLPAPPQRGAQPTPWLASLCRPASSLPWPHRCNLHPAGTALSQIVGLVEAAAASAGVAPEQRTTDAAARIFVPSCILLAMAAPVLWFCLVSGGHVTPAAANAHGEAFVHCEEVLFALKFGLVLLLVACPCALGHGRIGPLVLPCLWRPSDARGRAHSV